MWTLSHWTTREIPIFLFDKSLWNDKLMDLLGWPFLLCWTANPTINLKDLFLILSPKSTSLPSTYAHAHTHTHTHTHTHYLLTLVICLTYTIIWGMPEYMLNILSEYMLPCCQYISAATYMYSEAFLLFWHWNLLLKRKGEADILCCCQWYQISVKCTGIGFESQFWWDKWRLSVPILPSVNWWQ